MSGRARLRGERGSVTPFVAIVSIGILLLGALVIDGGRQLNAHGRALAYAQEAARAGAQGVDTASAHEEIATPMAMAAAKEFCIQAQRNDPELVGCAPGVQKLTTDSGTFDVVRVETRIQIDSVLLSMIGRHLLTAEGAALARPISGIVQPETDKLATQGPSLATPTAGPAPSTAPPPVGTVEPCPTKTPKPTKKPDEPGKPNKPGKPKPDCPDHGP